MCKNCQNDYYIFDLCDSLSTDVTSQQDTHQVFDMFISCKDCQEFSKKNSFIESTQPSQNFTFEKQEFQSISGEISLGDKQDDFFSRSSSINKINRKSSIQQFLIESPRLSRSEKLIFSDFHDDEQEFYSPSMEGEVNEIENMISIQIDDQVSILYEDANDEEPKPKTKKTKRTSKKRIPKGIRKGKNYQSKTQKFLKYMTRFHFSKNFQQFFNKGIKNHKFDPIQYESYSVDKKIQIIDLIINKEVQQYKMRMHYSVENGVFLKGFQEYKQNVEDLFHQVVRRVYVLMFETIKRRILYPEEEKQPLGYLDQHAEKQFKNVFGEILQTRSYYDELVAINFQSRLWNEIKG